MGMWARAHDAVSGVYDETTFDDLIDASAPTYCIQRGRNVNLQTSDNPHRRKLIGVYSQRQRELVLQRVKVPGGRLTGPQWRAMARIAARFTGATPLHLTTRQGIELHNLRPRQIPALQESLDRAGLTCLGAAGDTFRNITVCPCSGAMPGTPDLMPMARLIEAELGALEGIHALPRKFKIDLSCGPACGQPWINDLGLVAVRSGGGWRFRAVVGGSLGCRPGTGIPLRFRVHARDVLPLAVATVRFFAEHGDRRNRRKARLRHVRERMGDEAFARALLDAFEAALARRRRADVALPTAGSGFPARADLVFPNGDVTPAMADAIGRIASDNAFLVHIAAHHRAVVFGRDAAALRRKLNAFEALGAAALPQASVVACPGKRWCSRALTDTNELADRIRAELAHEIPPGATVCISGCPNGCSHAGVADIGLIGGRIIRRGRPCEVFTLTVGGGMGRTSRLAQPLPGRLAADEVIREIRARFASGEPSRSDHESVGR